MSAGQGDGKGNDAGVRVRGVVRAGSKIPFRRVTVKAEGSEPAVASELAVFQLDLDDGHRIAIEHEDAVKIEAPPSSRSGPWRELHAAGAAPGIKERALAPFVIAEVVTEAIAEGDVVEIFGQAVERRFADHTQGLRMPAQQRIATIRARAITAGPTAKVRMDALVKTLLPPDRDIETGLARVPQLMLFGLVLACTALVALRPWWGDLWRALIGRPGNWAAIAALQRQEHIAFVAALLPLCLLVAPRRDLPQFRSAEKPLYARKFDVLLVLAMLAFLLWPVLPFVAFRPPHSRATLGILCSAAVSNALMLLAAWRSGLPTVRLLRRLGQRPLTGPLAAGTRGVFAGTVADPTPAELDGDAVALGVESDWDHGIGSDPDVLRSSRFVSDAGFRLDTAAGPIAIDPRETVWASTHHTRTARNGDDYTIRERVLIGAPLLAEGVLAEGEVSGAGGAGLHLRAQGKEPVVLLAGKLGVDPGERVAEHLRGRRNLLLGLALALLLTGLAPLVG